MRGLVMLIRRLRSHVPDGSLDRFSRTLLDWLNSGPTFGDERRFLQRHPILLTSEADVLLRRLVEQYDGDRETQDELRDRLLILRDIRERLAPAMTSTAARAQVKSAIDDAYVNLHSGFVLDLPRWLRRTIRADEAYDRMAASVTVAAERIAIWREAHRRARQEGLAPPVQAEICGRLHLALSEDWSATRQASLVEAAQLLAEAIAHLSRARYPYLWASAQLALGILYRDRQGSDIADLIERAISCHEAALEVFTEEDFPYDRASTLNNLANAYVARPTGNREAHIELAIVTLRRALRIFTLETYPTQWAMVQHNLANAYSERRRGDRGRNLEEAIACFEAALTVRTRDHTPDDWAESRHDLGGVYVVRVRGDHMQNLEYALHCYRDVLAVFTAERTPHRWASIMHNMGVICAELAAIAPGTVVDDVAADGYDAYFERALAIYRPEGYPADHRGSSLMRAEAHARLGRFAAAHMAYTEALLTEQTLMLLADSVQAQDAVLATGRDGPLCDAYVLAQLGRYEEAVVVVERGRARGLAAAQAMDAADPARISEAQLRAEFIRCRDHWRAVLREVQQPADPRLPATDQRRLALERADALTAARSALDSVVVAIRDARDPADFLLDAVSADQLRLAVERDLPKGHALVYLIATPWGGVALAMLGAVPDQGLPIRFDALQLPRLTTALVADLIARDTDNTLRRTPGGFAYAQEGTGFRFIIQDWPGIAQARRVDELEEEWYTASIERLAQIEDELLQTRLSGTLAASLAQLVQQLGRDNAQATLREAMERVVSLPALAALTTVPYANYDKRQWGLAERALMYQFLRAELEHDLAVLANVAMQSLARWLERQGVSSCTLIPCGFLAAFPLLSCAIESKDTADVADMAVEAKDQDAVVADLFNATIAPSGRSVLTRAGRAERRAGVYTLGNPLPSPQPLRWGQAEALSLAQLSGDGTHAAIREHATREWALEKMQTATVFAASCHGAVDRDYLRSRLLLANRTSITLADALNGADVDVRGLRLLILSACQTALPDLRGARDEVRSLAAGWLQAGAQAVLASLWPVDDRATYLLMVRFAQIWFPHLATLHPADALAQAQHWLRHVTHADLRAWTKQEAVARVLEMMPPVSTSGDRQLADAVEDDDDGDMALLGIMDSPMRLPHGTMRGYGDYALSSEEGEIVSASGARALDAQTFITSASEDAAGDIRAFSARARQETARPYAHPYFWAAFQITGW